MAKQTYENLGPIYTTSAKYEAMKAAGTLELGREYRIVDWEAQEKLTSGTNIKTINNTSLLGEGNITVVQDVSGKQDKTDSSLATSSKTVVGAINELENDKVDKVSGSNLVADTKITNYDTHITNDDIHVTTANKTAWNAKYDKPSNGIPATDLTAAVQTSLGKADSAVQDTNYVHTDNNFTEAQKLNIIHYEDVEEPEEEEIVSYSEFEEKLATKVDKVNGKSLSTNDFTDTLKTKLDGIAAGAEVNVNADWNAASGDAQILNKPTKVSAFTNDSGYTTNTGTVTSIAIKMNGDTKGTVSTSGTIDLGTVITAHQDITGKQNSTDNSLATTAKTVVGAINEIQSNSIPTTSAVSSMLTEVYGS